MPLGTPAVAAPGLVAVSVLWADAGPVPASGICGGAGTPQPVIALLNRQIGAVVKSAEYREMIEKAGSVPVSSSPEELGKVLAETYEQTAAISREFGLQAD